MEWTPIVLVTFKLLVLGTGMYFAIKWHYDQGTKEKEWADEKRAILRAGRKVTVIFVLSLLALGFATYFFCRMIGLDLNSP